MVLGMSSAVHAQFSAVKDLQRLNALTDSAMNRWKPNYAPVIGISTGHYKMGNSGAPNTYVNAVLKAGGIPVMIPLVDNVSMLEDILHRVDGIVLTGGGDVDPVFYKESPMEKMGEVDSVRDAYDLTLIRLASKMNMPLLGICRGEQLINVSFGGTLYQDLPSQHPSAVNHHQTEERNVPTHEVRVADASVLSSVIGSGPMMVNSFHHQAIKAVAPGFKAVAWASDSIVEAIESPLYPYITAVQWHPEGLIENEDGVMLKLFRYLMWQASSSYRNRVGQYSKGNLSWKNKNTDWLYQAHVGAFMHFLPTKDNFKEVEEKFDVEGLANQLSKAKVPYFVFTLGQNTGYFNAPNPVYDKLTGYEAGERCSVRDIPMELALALKERGIRLLLYLPCQGPNKDLQAVKALGFPEEPKNNNRQVTEEGARNWASVIEYWSKHYGSLISGWWFDGYYSGVKHGYTSDIAALFAKAAKSGNENAIVTFNRGVVLKRASAAEDYTAGETNDPLKAKVTDRWMDGSQTHILTYIGDTWMQHNLRYQDRFWLDWLKDVISHGGAVSFDMGVNMDASKGKIGLFEAAQINQLSHLIKGVKDKK